MSDYMPEIVTIQKNGLIIAKHPLTGCFIFLHRLVKEMEVGRILTFDDIVYFRNSNRQDIELKNLALADRREYLRAKKSAKWPYLSKLVLWLLYYVLHFSTLTIGLIFNISPSLTRAMFEYRKVKRVPRWKLWRRWNKLVRQFIRFIRSRKEGRLATV